MNQGLVMAEGHVRLRTVNNSSQKPAGGNWWTVGYILYLETATKELFSFPREKVRSIARFLGLVIL